MRGTAESPTGCSRSSGGGGRWRAVEGGTVIAFHPLVRSPPQGPAAAHRSARTPARSGRCCGSRSHSGRPAPRATSPSRPECRGFPPHSRGAARARRSRPGADRTRSEEHTSELQSLAYLVCRLLLEKKKYGYIIYLHVTWPRYVI